MDRLGKKVIGIVVGVALFIGIQEVRSHFGSSSANSEAKVSQQDADLYMQVMRATAERVKNPTPEDQRIIDDFQRIPNVRTAQATDLSEDQKNTVWKAISITSGLDKTVAHDLHADEGRYESVKDQVESALSFPSDDNAQLSPELTPAEKKALESKGAPLGEHAEEIKELNATLWNNPLHKAVTGK